MCILLAHKVAQGSSRR